MPELLLDMKAAAPNSTKLVRLAGGVVGLRPENAAGVYDTSAALAKEFCTFPKVAGTGIRELWGLGVDADINGGTVEFQLSEDDGATWRHFNAGWVAAGAEDWSSIATTRKNIGTFPLGKGADRSMRVRMRLQPDSTARRTPVVRCVWFLAEYDHDVMVDFHRSMHAFLAALRFPVRCREAADGTDTVVLSDFGFSVDAAKPITVHNLTDQAGKGTDLFSAYDAGTKTVTMTGVQDASDVLEVVMQGSAPVHLVRDAFTHATQLPVVQFDVQVSQDLEQSAGMQTERNVETKIARERPGPDYREVRCTVSCIDKDQERAMQMVGVVRRAFEDQGFVLSLATGRQMLVVQAEPLAPKVSLNDGVHSPQVGCTVWVREDSRTYRQHVLVDEVSLTIHGEELANVRKLLDPKVVWQDESLKATS